MPIGVGDKTFVVKSFLSALLYIETGSEYSYTRKSNLFEKLVLLFVETLDYQSIR